jgi:hypothetical protein
VVINNKKFKMLVVGLLSKDYEYFYKGITKWVQKRFKLKR